MWIQKAKEFDLLYDFPNCIGLIDGKHVEIQVQCIIYIFYYYNEKKNHF